MVSDPQFREWALELPESEEHSHSGRPSFRSRKRIFATLPEPGQAVLKLPADEQDAVVSAMPEIFSLGGWSHQGWTHVDLGSIGEEMLRDLLELSWRGVATQRAQKALEERRGD